MNRRQFVKNAGIMATLSDFGLNNLTFSEAPVVKQIRVTEVESDFEREKLMRPIGFKGGYLTELWQTVSKMKSASGSSKIGIATQSVLYGDADLFAAHSEAEGNALMYVLTNKALQLVKKIPFSTPIDLFEKLLPQLLEAGKVITAKADLNINFLYNSLVGVDNAAWLLYAQENKISNFDALIPAPYRKALSHHNDKIAIMYQIPYGMKVSEVQQAVGDGYFVLKIKTGYPGTQDEMLEHDMARLTEIHNAVKDLRTGHTKNGKLIYTMDANGRYEKKETLLRYLDHAREIGAFEQILVYEEPFVESNDELVGDLGVRIGADESVHDETSALKRLSQGYNVIVLKGIAKTLSLSMKIAKLAFERNIPCLCADLTVNPILIDWHKNLAGRLAPFPELGMGLMETNGDMNYKEWSRMMGYHPMKGADWITAKNGTFELDDNFYQQSGGIFASSVHYESLFHH